MREDMSDDELPESAPDEASQSASMWLARINRGLRPNEAAELRGWLKVPRHRHVILDMARRYFGPDIVAVLSELFPVGPEPMESEALKDLLKVTATIVAICGLVFLAATGRQPWSNMRAQWDARHHEACAPPTKDRITGLRGMYSTAVGGMRELTLPDQSTVTLNTNTCIGVAYAPSMRTIVLPYGEATFHVVHDPERRPFFVRAGTSRKFEAVGTDFNVRVLSPDHVELTVADGAVRVLYSNDSLPETPAEARLRANWTLDDTTVGPLHTALVEPGMQFVRKLDVSDLHTLLAWQQGLLFFDGTTLENVLAEVDRYTTTQFVLADDQLRNIRIGGRFRTGDVEGLLASLRTEFMIGSRRDAQGRVVLSALGSSPRT
jgi:transmembrane sensor